MHHEDPVGDESFLRETHRGFDHGGKRQAAEALVEFHQGCRRRGDQDTERPGLRAVAPGRGEAVESAADPFEGLEHSLVSPYRATRAAVERGDPVAARLEHHTVGGSAQPVHGRLHHPGREHRGHRGIGGIPALRQYLGAGARGGRGHRGHRAGVPGNARPSGPGNLLAERSRHSLISASSAGSAFPPQSGVRTSRLRNRSGCSRRAAIPAAPAGSTTSPSVR